jgi:ribonuclease HI
MQWVRSFLANRTAHIRLDKVKSKAFSVLCGLPQGSPISPILFLLYVEPFLRLTRGRFGYADDGAILATGTTTQVVHAKLQKHLDITLAWGKENGVLFDSAKTELQYFHRKRQADDPPLRLPDGQEILPNDITRWLGVFFDRKLWFKAHVQIACLRAKQITDHIRRLCRTVKGANPALLRQAVQGCAFATLFYGAETWYGKYTSPAIFRLIQLAINQAARAVLLVYKTTPTLALLRETGWAPALAWLEKAHDRFVARVAAADERHLLRTRWGSGRMKWMRRRQELALSSTFFRPPWEDVDRDSALKQIAACGRTTGPQAFKQWLDKQPILDLIVYSDGSMNENGNAGAAYCIYRGSQLLEQGQVPLGKTAEVYDAEIAGALAGLQAALRTCMARFATNVTICLDNQEAALRLHTGIPTSTSPSEIIEFQACRQAWFIRERARNAACGAVDIRWCPAHVGIAGNELADQLAKDACLVPTTRTQASIACAQRLSKLRYKRSAAEYWSEKCPTQYKRLDLSFSTSRIPMELTFPRPILGYLLAARSGHGDFRAYHERFNHEDATICCHHCNQDSSLDHFAIYKAISPPFELFAPAHCPNCEELRAFPDQV